MNFHNTNECYIYGFINPVSIQYAFTSKLDTNDDVEIDNFFDWILVENKVILPLSYTRVRAGAAGTGEGSCVDWSFEYELIHEFDTDIMSVIKEKSQLCAGKPRKTKWLISAIYDCVTNKSNDDYEFLMDFK